ncbi:uncharacterized protein [Chironomus tepperi]|uniref:uncharacterized protein n=1 Tax=Chironomus tepperi TaxID=113505 RepID=UPI00391FAC6B
MSKGNKRKHDIDKNADNKRVKFDISVQKSLAKPGINELPNEMLLNIFSYLDQKDILTATLVMKKWNKLISNTEKIMQKIQKIYIDTANMISGVPKFTRPYAKIDVVGVKLECDLSLLNRLRKIGDGIDTILFDHCWFLGNAMTSFLKCFKNVENLNITHCEITEVPVQHKVILRELSLLHLDISTWPLLYIEAPRLNKLQCHSMLVEDPKILINFLNQQTTLEILDLNCFYNLFHSSAVQLNPRFKLKKLTLIDLVNYDKDQMLNLLSTMTESLTTLDVGIDMGNYVTKYVLENFINLESLVIDCDSLPKTPYFYTDIKTSQTLKKVEINGELDKTISVLHFLENHPEIEILDMSLLFNIPSTRYSFWNRLAGVTQKVSCLTIDVLDSDNIHYIKSKNLKFFDTHSLEVIDIANWIEFCRNNPNIERFHVCATDDSFNINDVKVVLTQNLPKLREFSVDYSPTITT